MTKANTNTETSNIIIAMYLGRKQLNGLASEPAGCSRHRDLHGGAFEEGCGYRDCVSDGFHFLRIYYCEDDDYEMMIVTSMMRTGENTIGVGRYSTYYLLIGQVLV